MSLSEKRLAYLREYSKRPLVKEKRLAYERTYYREVLRASPGYRASKNALRKRESHRAYRTAWMRGRRKALAAAVVDRVHAAVSAMLVKRASKKGSPK